MLSLLLAGSAELSGQGLTQPVGYPTGTAGAGNARTDPDNFFLSNNPAGLTEIPVTLEEETSGKATGRNSSGKWRFFGEIQPFTSSDKVRLFFSGSAGNDGFGDFGGSSRATGFAGEATYTSANHKYGFGIGTYRLVNYRSHIRGPWFDKLDLVTDTHVVSTDFSTAGAVRLGKKLSVGGSLVFGKAAYEQEEPSFSGFHPRVSTYDAHGFGGPGFVVGMHWRPVSFLSIGLNYKSKRTYSLPGTARNQTFLNVGTGQFAYLERTPVEVNFSVPRTAEGGVAVRPIRKLTVAADFRFLDYSQTFDEMNARVPKSRLVDRKLLGIFGRDFKSIRLGGVYAVNDALKLNFGAVLNSSWMSYASARRTFVNRGSFVVGGISRKISNGWIMLSFGAGRKPRSDNSPGFGYSTGDYSTRGIVFGIGFRR